MAGPTFTPLALVLVIIAALGHLPRCSPFRPISVQFNLPKATFPSKTLLSMAFLDPISYSRTEFITSAILTNQIPRSSKVVLQIGTEDPRCVYYLPRSVSEILCHPTYSAEKGKLPFRARRQLDQAKERRGQMEATEIKAIELEAEDGIATKKGGMLYGVESDTVDVVVWTQIADEMKKFYEKGGRGEDKVGPSDWFEYALKDVNRVLKEGGRVVFIEREEVEDLMGTGRKIGFVDALRAIRMDDTFKMFGPNEDEGEEGDDQKPIEEIDLGTYASLDVAFDKVDFCPAPHIAGVAIKRSSNPDEDLAEKGGQGREMNIQERMLYEKRTADAELAFEAFERGRRKGRRKGERAEEKKEEAEQTGKWARGSERKPEKEQLDPIKKLRNFVSEGKDS